jgi:hypothetical protein
MNVILECVLKVASFINTRKKFKMMYNRVETHPAADPPCTPSFGGAVTLQRHNHITLRGRMNTYDVTKG